MLALGTFTELLDFLPALNGRHSDWGDGGFRLSAFGFRLSAFALIAPLRRVPVAAGTLHPSLGWLARRVPPL